MEPGATRISQLRRGVLEHCVLALLDREALYGFDLVRRLAEIEGLVVSEGTIYPLLSRMRREGHVTTTWSESEAGPPRRYYTLTPAGRQALRTFTQEWVTFRNSVDRLLLKEQA